MKRVNVAILSAILLCSLFGQAQQTVTTTNAIVPPLLSFNGVLNDVNGKPLTRAVGVIFSLYQDQQGGPPLWLETQNVKPNSTGHYTVTLGSTTSQGIPADLFASGEAHWLGVQVQGQPEQPRVLLMSVPYALKALDAETVGGKPASAFAPALSSATTGKNALPPGTITGSGTADYVPKFTGTTTIGNSKIFQTVGGDIGIGTTTPTAELDVKGTGDIRDTLTLFPKSTHATLSVHGTAFEVSSTGLVTFISGQTFPGAGTVTSVASGAGLTGGPITKSGTLSIASAGVTNTMLKNPSLTVTAGTDLTGGGAVSLGGSTTLNLDTTKVPQLNAANTFTGNQKITGNLSDTGNISATGSISGQTASFTGNNTTNILNVTQNGAGLAIMGNGGITGNSAAASGFAVAGFATGNNGAGIYGAETSTTGVTYGVYGTITSSTDGAAGVYGQTNAGSYAGTFGQNGSLSATGAGLPSSTVGVEGAGVWGDGGSAGGFIPGVVGTADSQNAGVFVNNSGNPTLFTGNLNASGYPFAAINLSTFGSCNVDPSGDLNCTGSKNAVVPIDGGTRKVALSAIESPKNWFEDFGSAQLSNGSAVVAIDPEFAQTVNTATDYMVIPVPNGDCKGLYVANKTPASFEVRELGGGTSSIRFDYRIVVLRKNYENVRFADHTNDPDPRKMMRRIGQPDKPETKPTTAPINRSALLHPALAQAPGK